MRKVWLFTMVLGHSRWTWGSFCALQYLQTVLRCHIEPFAAMAGAPGLELCSAGRPDRLPSCAPRKVRILRSIPACNGFAGAWAEAQANRFRKEF